MQESGTIATLVVIAMSDIGYEQIGQRIKHFRRLKKLTQEQLGEFSGVSTSHISNIERGYTKLSLDTLLDICHVLDVSPDDLLCDSLEKSRPEFERELSNILADCTETELRIITDTAAAIKQSLRARLPDASKE